jgi:hypothetical protein
MDEKELIAKIKELRQIKPNQEWVLLTKNRILGKTPVLREKTKLNESIISVLRVFSFGSVLKPSYLGVLSLFIIVGLFGFAQNSVPGDYLYALKRIYEKSQMLFASEKEKQQISLELVNKRLDELTQVVESNQTKKLAPALREFQSSLAEAAAGSEVKKVVEIRKKADEIKSKGIVIEDEELKRLELESFASVLKNLIADLESRTLTTKQEVVLDKMKELYEKGEYSQALELWLRNQ